ncbi:Hsp20/alpha crystallin family protein [Oesophagostomum dentatum]|uniref:Hsp20/alpha crystallin family protein n=1 Tax=Oesophagostomum dentatum TaxID=61180 RepID=A0A0B1TP39_OESDE|nr:Hsp20/alpha crystallin family protein [Oesophagostomum dentatum]
MIEKLKGNNFYDRIKRETRYPPSTQNHYDYPQDSRPNYRDSRIDSKGVSVVSRPGSPGPVAGAGDVINTPHGFTIQLDVKLFRPEQIKVVLTEDLLCVSGERIEVGVGGQTLKRSFARKYCIPSDIHLDSIRSHLDHSGVLIISGSRRGWKETNISIHPDGYGSRHSNSLISTV